MKSIRRFCALAIVAALMTPAARAQEPPKLGPERDQLKKLAGTWETTMKFGDMESKGSVTYKMEVGGMWLVGSMESDLFGQKFHGKSLDSYNADKKKFFSVWVDSMGAGAVITEGTYDKAKKTMTMEGEGPGMDGKPAKYKSVTVMPDDDNFTMTMYIGDGKEPMFTVAYKRKK